MSKEKEITQIETWTNVKLPAVYRNFLQKHEESFFGDRVLLYPADYLIERNETFETKLYCPGYIAIGDDSGGRAFVISLSDESIPVFVVGQGYMAPDGFERVADNFSNWIQNECPIGDEDA